MINPELLESYKEEHKFFYTLKLPELRKGVLLSQIETDISNIKVDAYTDVTFDKKGRENTLLLDVIVKFELEGINQLNMQENIIDAIKEFESKLETIIEDVKE